jgi:hypothetical protein
LPKTGFVFSGQWNFLRLCEYFCSAAWMLMILDTVPKDRLKKAEFSKFI